MKPISILFFCQLLSLSTYAGLDSPKFMNSIPPSEYLQWIVHDVETYLRLRDSRDQMQMPQNFSDHDQTLTELTKLSPKGRAKWWSLIRNSRPIGRIIRCEFNGRLYLIQATFKKLSAAKKWSPLNFNNPLSGEGREFQMELVISPTPQSADNLVKNVTLGLSKSELERLANHKNEMVTAIAYSAMKKIGIPKKKRSHYECTETEERFPWERWAKQVHQKHSEGKRVWSRLRDFFFSKRNKQERKRYSSGTI